MCVLYFAAADVAMKVGGSRVLVLRRRQVAAADIILNTSRRTLRINNISHVEDSEYYYYII